MKTKRDESLIIRVSTKIDESTYRRLEKYASRGRRTTSGVVRQAINEFLDRIGAK